MSELDGLEEIDLTAHGDSSRSAKRIRNGRKQARKFRVQSGNWNWKKVLHCYQTRKSKKVEK